MVVRRCSHDCFFPAQNNFVCFVLLKSGYIIMQSNEWKWCVNCECSEWVERVLSFFVFNFWFRRSFIHADTYVCPCSIVCGNGRRNRVSHYRLHERAIFLPFSPCHSLRQLLLWMVNLRLGFTSYFSFLSLSLYSFCCCVSQRRRREEKRNKFKCSLKFCECRQRQRRRRQQHICQKVIEKGFTGETWNIDRTKVNFCSFVGRWFSNVSAVGVSVCMFGWPSKIFCCLLSIVCEMFEVLAFHVSVGGEGDWRRMFWRTKCP